MRNSSNTEENSKNVQPNICEMLAFVKFFPQPSSSRQIQLWETGLALHIEKLALEEREAGEFASGILKMKPIELLDSSTQWLW